MDLHTSNFVTASRRNGHFAKCWAFRIYQGHSTIISWHSNKMKTDFAIIKFFVSVFSSTIRYKTYVTTLNNKSIFSFGSWLTDPAGSVIKTNRWKWTDVDRLTNRAENVGWQGWREKPRRFDVLSLKYKRWHHCWRFNFANDESKQNALIMISITKRTSAFMLSWGLMLYSHVSTLNNSLLEQND